MTPRSNFTNEFLCRELLSSLGAPLTTVSEPADSFSESLSDDTESQVAITSHPSRVMLVRRINSLHQIVTLVDREYEIEAFIPHHVISILHQDRGYETVGRLRGSVVRVTKYYFATMTRCLFTDQQNRTTSMSMPNKVNKEARVYLWVDALAIVEDNELAIQPHPEVYGHPLVAERLHTLNDAELEEQLMINQGLPLLPDYDRYKLDDDLPLLEEDCVIPEDQEQALEEQEEWGPPITKERQPTDSELIEENGAVPLSESQINICEADKAQSTQDSITSLGDLSATLSVNSLSGDLEDQRFQFQQENIRETFVAGSDSDDSDVEGRDVESEEFKELVPRTPRSDPKAGSSRKDTSVRSNTTATQNYWAVVDLTGDFIEQDSQPSIVMINQRDQNQEQENQRTRTIQNQKKEITTGTDGTREEKVDVEVSLVLSYVSPKVHQTAKRRTSATSWGFFNTLASMFSTEDPGDTVSDKEEDDLAVGDQDHKQSLDQEEKQGEGVATEDKLAAEGYTSSQATMVLHYVIDNDEDANAFEYEGVASPRSLLNEQDDVETGENLTLLKEKEGVINMTLAEERPEVTSTPQRESGVTKKSSDLECLSKVARTATLGTDDRTETGSHRSHLPASQCGDNNMKNRDLPGEVSGKSISISTPPKIVISVDCDAHRASRTGFSYAGSQGRKRSHFETGFENVAASITTLHANARSDGQSRRQQLKRCRRDIIPTREAYETGSQSPQFECSAAWPFFQRRRELDRSTSIEDLYSLDTVCRLLGSDLRSEFVEEKQIRSIRQPRRAWKRYENLFPPLNMALLKQLMTEGK